MSNRIAQLFLMCVMGLSACQPSSPIAQPGGVPLAKPTSASRYEIVAKGFELNDSTGKVDPAKLKADFGVVYGGIGWGNPFPNYEANVQALEQAKIPCVLLWDVRIPAEFNASNLDKTFPPENEEPNVAAIAKTVKNKPVAGIIIRFTDKKIPDGKEFTQAWMANYVTWMVSAVYHQTNKPLYVMTSQAFIKGFGNAEELNRVISGIDGMSSWKAMGSEQVVQTASWTAFPIPADDYVPEYISNNKSLSFINYARKAYRFDGIEAGSTPLWMYSRPADQLRKDLRY